MLIRLKYMNWTKIQVTLVMILSLVLIPVSGSNASNLLQPEPHLQTIETHHAALQDGSIQDRDVMAEKSSHTHDGASLADCCSLNCGSAIVAEVRPKTIGNPSESHILPAHRLLQPSEWDTQLRPPKT